MSIKALDGDVARCCAQRASFRLFTIVLCSGSFSVGPPGGSTQIRVPIKQ